MSTSHLRAYNRATLLETLRAAGPLPRVELAERSRLSATLVTKAIADLIDEGVAAEAPKARPTAGRVGRPAIDVMLVADARHVCGVQVGVGSVQLAICDLLARVVDEAAFTFDPMANVEEVLGEIESGIEALVLRSGIARESLLGVGIGAPGPVDAAQRSNLISINLGWRNVPFSDHVEEALGIPTVVDHNVRAMAVAEARFGAARGVESLAFLYLRTGVGAGLILAGQPYRGGTHGATEIGHLRVDAGDRPCSCGSSGCLETVASEGYLAERVRTVAGVAPASFLGREIADGRTPTEALIAAGKAGDSHARQILEETAGHLATGLANLVNLLNPELIVVGGFFTNAGELLVGPLRQALRSRAFPLLRDVLRVELTTFGSSVGVVGAAAVALDRFFYKPPFEASSRPGSSLRRTVASQATH